MNLNTKKEALASFKKHVKKTNELAKAMDKLSTPMDAMLDDLAQVLDVYFKCDTFSRLAVQ